MRNVEEIKEYIRKALEPVYNNEKYGKTLVHDPVFARFWEGRMIEIEYHKKNLETILEMLKD
ncbi:MAG: hypothetical protein K5870_01090 [Lachnospiraceae bacterium]|nr:hypothetical protein [Lachnospiraceae bacterium]